MRIQALKVIDSDLTHTVLENTMMNGKEMAFIRVNLAHAKWAAPNLMESYWYKTNLDQAEFKNAEWSAARIIRSYFHKAILNESRFPDAVFLATRISDSNLKGVLLEGATFKYSYEHNNNMDLVDVKHVTRISNVVS